VTRLFREPALLRHAEPEPFVGPGTPEYRAFWQHFHAGAGSFAPEPLDFDASDRVRRYAQDGLRIGKLFRKLPCMKGRDR
jgi:hypothetical protein